MLPWIPLLKSVNTVVMRAASSRSSMSKPWASFLMIFNCARMSLSFSSSLAPGTQATPRGARAH